MVLKKRLPQVVNDVSYRDKSYEDHIFVSSFNFEVPALASPMTHSRKMFSSKQLTQVDTKMYLREQILQSHKRLLRGACYHWLERMYYVLIMNVSLFMHSDNHIRCITVTFKIAQRVIYRLCDYIFWTAVQAKVV